MVLATSTPVAQMENYDPYLKAEVVRAEAMKTLHNLDTNQHLRRALLRKTRATRVADLLPGQKCAYWRWQRRGPKKRGSWIIGRFLSWDPSHVGKQAWIRTGSTTTLVTAEQLRAAFGFEDWSPNEQDVQALKDASTTFHRQIMDDRGPQPVEDELHPLPEDDQIQVLDDPYPMTPAMTVPATPGPEPEAVQPQTPHQQPQITSLQQTATAQQSIQQQLQQSVNIHSPTNIQHIEQHYRFGGIPTQRTTRRARSRTPSQRGPAMLERPHDTVQTPQQDQQDPHAPPSQQGSAQETLEQQEQQQAEQQQPSTPVAPASMQAQSSSGILPPPSAPDTDTQAQAASQQQNIPFHDDANLDVAHPFIDPTEVINVDDDEQPSEPPNKQPRTQETLVVKLHNVVMYLDCDGTIKHLRRPQDPATWQCFGAKPTGCYQAYLLTDQRKKDVKSLGKDPQDPDTSDDSDESEDEAPKSTATSKTSSPTTAPLYKQGLSRQELKAMDREIPWRSILSMPEPHVEKFIEAVNKEASSWSEWQSVEPLSDHEAQQIFNDKELKKRIIPARACYRDKSCGVGELRAKCRVVALGHLDPDLAEINRSSGTPGRVSEHMIFVMITAGFNRELFGTKHLWKAWSADAATAFLQGQQARRMPIFLKPPNDGLIQLTNHWKAKLYRVRGNIYGLADAPATWSKEVIGRLTGAQYRQHSFDQQVFYKVVNKEIVSIILVYVDDFLGLFRDDYDLGEIHALFRWGAITHFEEGKPVTFKGKELTIVKTRDRFQLKITMTSFINSLDVGVIKKGRLQQNPALTPEEQKELRSVSGCLQWISTQCRPEVSAIVSLTGHGAEATITDLRNLYAVT